MTESSSPTPGAALRANEGVTAALLFALLGACSAVGTERLIIIAIGCGLAALVAAIGFLLTDWEKRHDG